MPKLYAALSCHLGTPEFFNLQRMGIDDAGRTIYDWQSGGFIDPHDNHRYVFVEQPRRFSHSNELRQWLAAQEARA